MPFIYTTIFWEDSKLGSVVGGMGEGGGGGGGECGFIIICLKIGLLNFSPCSWSPFFFVPNNWDLL